MVMSKNMVDSDLYSQTGIKQFQSEVMIFKIAEFDALVSFEHRQPRLHICGQKLDIR